MQIYLYIVSGRIFFIRGRTKPKIILNGCDFKLVRTKENVTFWTCSTYEKTRCKCRLRTTSNIVEVRCSHNHGPKNFDLSNCSFKDVQIINHNQDTD